MNSLVSCLIRTVIAVPTLITLSFGQDIYDPGGAVRNQVAQLVEAKFGSGYRFSYTMFDAQIRSSNDGKKQDPYGTLAGCVLFSAHKREAETSLAPDSSIVGMVKNGQIIWDNFPGSREDFKDDILESGLIFSQDLNNDGEVDLVFADAMRVNVADVLPSAIFIRILSWNGTRGRLISGPMVGLGHYELLDEDGDGVYVIRCMITFDDGKEINAAESYKTNTYPYVTYGWNGTLYGLWPAVRQIPDDELIPGNRFLASIRCSVERRPEGFLYSYTVANAPESKQSIQWISIEGPEDTSAYSAPAPWTSGSSVIGGRRFDVEASNVRSAIKPGGSMGGFLTLSKGLPDIVRCHLLGYNGTVCCRTPDLWMTNILHNSVGAFTIGPRDSTARSDSLALLDSLSYFISRSRENDWISTQSTADRYISYYDTARRQLQDGDNGGARRSLQLVLRDVAQDSIGNITSEAYALIRYNTEYLLAHIPEPGLAVKLVNTAGSRIAEGTLQYYEGGWKDAINHNDGTFSVNTTLHNVTLRMTLEGGTQTKTNVTVGPDTAVFQTVASSVRLLNSQGIPIDTGAVQYYAGGAWREFGRTSNGVAIKELLPGTYSFRMSYASGSIDKQQDVGTNPTVTFQTVAATVQLQSSQGTMIDQGTVQYYAGAWRALGTTSNGTATKELLPNTYSFRMTYAYGSTDKQQNTGANPTVVFQTVACTVRLLNSQGSPIDQGTVQYYSGAWRDFGTTANGIVAKELLPKSYSFRMTYAYASTDKAQDLSVNSTVDFSTVLATIRVKNSQGQPVSGAQTSYYSGAWRTIGATVNGEITKQLLPVNMTFRVSVNGTSQDKAQNLSTNPVVEFTTQP